MTYKVQEINRMVKNTHVPQASDNREGVIDKKSENRLLMSFDVAKRTDGVSTSMEIQDNTWSPA